MREDANSGCKMSSEKEKNVTENLTPIVLERDHPEYVEMRVKGTTPVDKLAGSITKFIQDGKIPILFPIALPAQNQALKGAAKCKQHLAPVGKYVLWDPCFTTRMVRDEETGEMEPRTAIKLIARVYKAMPG